VLRRKCKQLGAASFLFCQHHRSNVLGSYSSSSLPSEEDSIRFMDDMEEDGADQVFSNNDAESMEMSSMSASASLKFVETSVEVHPVPPESLSPTPIELKFTEIPSKTVLVNSINSISSNRTKVYCTSAAKKRPKFEADIIDRHQQTLVEESTASGSTTMASGHTLAFKFDNDGNDQQIKTGLNQVLLPWASRSPEALIPGNNSRYMHMVFHNNCKIFKFTSCYETPCQCTTTSSS
jgi:hypothetical protein